MSSSLSGNTWQNISDAVVTDGQLRKQNINRNDAGTYRCTASNMIIPTAGQSQEGFSSRTFILKVLYKASVSSFTEVNHPTMHEVTVSENSSIRLQCEVDSYPGSRIRILKDGETQNSTENTSQISFTNSKVACDTAGIYSCVGFNEYNTEENKASKDLKLFVTCSPRLSSTEDFKSTITSSLDEVTRIKITVIAFPVPKYSDFVWFRWNGSTWETLTNDNTKIINTHGLESTLIFLRVKESDFQRYRVIVRNSVGQFQQEFFLERQAEPTKTEAKAVVNGGMVGGIVGGVVVIIFVVAVAVVCILRRSRFLQRKELERKEELRLGDHSSPVDLQNIQTGSKATTEYANVHTVLCYYVIQSTNKSNVICKHY
ncbi:hemicentin-1-like [Mercenaria mercenaria]|uniref:hemicentin-1-like n=1 Tax=Mercenaria mercenaria TaxID=6596 RepID=UPI00234E3B12|nr:hemicentin-1-like [Mercenaria mercenaria]